MVHARPAWFAAPVRGQRGAGGGAGSAGFDLCSELRLLLSVGWESPAQEKAAMGYLARDRHLTDPSFRSYQAIAAPNITLRPPSLVPRKTYEASDFHAVRLEVGIEDFLFSQRHTADRAATFCLSPQRPPRDRCFSAGDVELLRLFHDELALLVGNVLSDGRADPLDGLSPRLRQALALLLGGDSEKEAALRMRISRHTVHEYVVHLYKHFRVNSRAELLALCRRRRIGESH